MARVPGSTFARHTAGEGRRRSSRSSSITAARVARLARPGRTSSRPAALGAAMSRARPRPTCRRADASSNSWLEMDRLSSSSCMRPNVTLGQFELRLGGPRWRCPPPAWRSSLRPSPASARRCRVRVRVASSRNQELAGATRSPPARALRARSPSRLRGDRGRGAGADRSGGLVSVDGQRARRDGCTVARRWGRAGVAWPPAPRRALPHRHRQTSTRPR